MIRLLAMAWTLIIQIILGTIFLEFASFVLTKNELFLVNSTPKIYSKNSNYPDILKGRTEKDAFGAWHIKNSTFRQADSCFDILMSFNEFGARDSSFRDAEKNSIFLLGDSFAEGFGVSYSDTSQYILEKKINRQILNFGSAGSFGPLQELILYKKFKDTIDHAGLLVYVLPANDFTENDQEIWRNIDQTRYRPYYSNGEDILEPFYFSEATKRETFDDQKGLKSFIKDHFWLSNAVRSFLILFGGQSVISSDNLKSFYYESSKKQQTQLIAAYTKIVELANNRDVLFVIIPSKNDILKYYDMTNRKKYKTQYWYRELTNLEFLKNQNVQVLDLLDHLPSKIENLFLPCDGHWSKEGNNWAANKIHEKIITKKLFRVN